jgi:hypothetical protein
MRCLDLITYSGVRFTSDVEVRLDESGVLLEEANEESVEVIGDLILVLDVTVGVSDVRVTSTVIMHVRTY